MSIGSLMIDLDGLTVGSHEVEKLQHPLTGGVILFSRNFENFKQLQSLCSEIKSTARQEILIAVDQEGGRVQRFHQEFSQIPAMGRFKSLAIEKPVFAESEILQLLTDTGWLMASELICAGVDISFAPVLDLDKGISEVIGERGFGGDVEQVINYSTAFMKGMNKAGMSATGKHFPGHGSTRADSHFEQPIDTRPLVKIRSEDMRVFESLINQGLKGIMPAHVIYSAADPLPACFSSFWLNDILRKELRFNGTIFSDDLSMEGAKFMGDIQSRAQEALDVGCDMILCCNDSQSLELLFDKLPQKVITKKSTRIKSMINCSSATNFQQLTQSEYWLQTHRKLLQMNG